MEKQYILSVFTENNVGLLNKISIIFTRRHINIESFTASETEIKDVFRFTIVVTATREKVDKLKGQIEKIVDVLKAFIHEENEVIQREVALYKVSARGAELDLLAERYHAKVIDTTAEYIVIEKTGTSDETGLLLKKLEPFGVMEFARSGQVAIIKWSRRFHTHLKALEEASASYN